MDINIINIIFSYSYFDTNTLVGLAADYNLDITKIVSNDYYNINYLYIFKKGIIIKNIEIMDYFSINYIKTNKNIKNIMLYAPFNGIIFEKFPCLEIIELIDNNYDRKHNYNLLVKNNIDKYKNIKRCVSLKEVILEKDCQVDFLGSFFKHILYIEKLSFKKSDKYSSLYFYQDIFKHLKSIKIKELFIYSFFQEDIDIVISISNLCNIENININLFNMELDNYKSLTCFTKINIKSITVNKFIDIRSPIYVRDDQKIVTNDKYIKIITQ